MMNQSFASLILIPTLGAAQAVPERNIVETAVAAGKFQTLAKALAAADLVETLSGMGPFTVFAPTDEAFSKLPRRTLTALLEPGNKAKLVDILTYHVVAGNIDAASALSARSAATAQGDKVDITLRAGQLTVNDAKVIATDIRASNGIIHVLDSVLLPPQSKAPEELPADDACRRIIEDAIAAGVPLFNGGQPGACTAVYRIAALSVSLLGRKVLSESARRDLQKAIARVDSHQNTVDNAWTLRGALDGALRELMIDNQNAETPAKQGRQDTKTVFEFDSPDATRWFAVNDDVMGGISKGGMSFDPDAGLARFRGALSLENNGGFSTVRAAARDLGLAGYDGLWIRVRGDGRTYRLQALSGDSRWRSRIFQREFRTTKGEWTEVRIPFEELVLSIRGRRIPGYEIAGADVRSVGFSIADKNEAPFALEIDWIKAYRAAGSATF